MFTETMTQAISIPGQYTGNASNTVSPTIVPANKTTNQTIGPIQISPFRRFMAHVVLGATAGDASSNLQVFFTGAATSGGSYANITGGSTVTVALNNTSNTELTLEIRADQFNSGNQFLKLNINFNGGNAAAFLCASVFGGECAYKPGSAQDPTGTALTRTVT